MYYRAKIYLRYHFSIPHWILYVGFLPSKRAGARRSALRVSENGRLRDSGQLAQHVQVLSLQEMCRRRHVSWRYLFTDFRRLVNTFHFTRKSIPVNCIQTNASVNSFWYWFINFPFDVGLLSNCSLEDLVLRSAKAWASHMSINTRKLSGFKVPNPPKLEKFQKMDQCW